MPSHLKFSLSMDHISNMVSRHFDDAVVIEVVQQEDFDITNPDAEKGKVIASGQLKLNELNLSSDHRMDLTHILRTSDDKLISLDFRVSYRYLDPNEQGLSKLE